jgi:hypothetical protein
MFALLLRAITPSCWPGSLSMRRLGKMGAARAIGVGVKGREKEPVEVEEFVVHGCFWRPAGTDSRQ